MESGFKFTQRLKLILVATLLLSSPGIGFSQEKDKTYYECSPCGCADDGKISLSPGDCPSCSMPLVQKTAAEIPNVGIFTPLKTSETPMNVAIFLYAQNQVLDFAGPYDAFVAGGSSFNVYTVGATQDPIITYPNLSINPQYSIHNAPNPDIIIIPAGLNNTVNQETREWIVESAEKATYILSVCNGAFLIAELGLLDGLEATCHASGLNRLEQKFTKIKKVHRHTRYVDNGKVITSGGVSAGIDASFYLMSKILGEDRAQAAANGLEYIYWNPKE